MDKRCCLRVRKFVLQSRKAFTEPGYRAIFPVIEYFAFCFVLFSDDPLSL